MKSLLFCISTHISPLYGDWFADDKGGCLFVDRMQAERCKSRHRLHTSHVVNCGLDTDLAQMNQLYNEQANAPTPQTTPSPAPSA